MLKLIKWFFKTVLFLTGILPLLKCSSGYKEKNGKISFNGKEITDKSFVVLSDVFAKDSVNAYYKEKSISGADVASFTAVDEYYAKDKNNVYYCDEYREGQNYYLTKKQTISTAENALPASFVSIGNGYAKDSVHGFRAYIAFNVKDIATLKSINSVFVKDDVQAYFNLKPVAGSDGKSFEVIDNSYAKDTAHIYYYAQPGEVKSGIYVLPCNRSAFKVLDYPYSKDDVTVFYENIKMNGAHAATFTVLQNGFSKDKNAVYFEAQKIAGADASSFMVFKENELYTENFYYAKDNTSIFWENKKLADANIANFKVLGMGYGSDGKHVFYKTNIIKNADPDSFKVYPHDVGDADAEDAANKYHEGVKVQPE